MFDNILINGFSRSGTTYLYRYLNWLTEGRALWEPLHPDIGKALYKSFTRNITSDITKNYLKIIKNFEQLSFIIKHNPGVTSRLFFKYEDLKRYLLIFKDFSIKEVTLHFYLDRDFIKKNWKVYHIIRHPADVFLSILNISGLPKKVLFKLKPFQKFLLKYEYDLYFIRNHEILEFEYRFLFNKKLRSFKELFIAVWTITNYFALCSINPKKHLIIYEKPETYCKLPKWEEWLKIEPLKIKKYKARKKYEKEFYEIAKKLGIEQEFKELMSLFKE